MKNYLQWITLGVLVALGVVILGGWADAVGANLDEWLLSLSEQMRDAFGEDFILGQKWMVMGLIGVVFVSLICGSVSSAVVSNRMAFFSDALAHCAFAGIAIGIIAALVAGISVRDTEALKSIITPTMIVFGVLIGTSIAFVRDKTSLANDTVIGVFFAGAMGLGAVLLVALSRAGSRISPETYLFGELIFINGVDIIYLSFLLLATVAFFLWRYNQFVFVSFNPSLGRSRNFSTRLDSYLFIILLGLIVNICFPVIGILLINAVLVLPAATASNMVRNLRQFFWIATLFSFVAGLTGLLLSHYWSPVIGNQQISLPTGGTIVLVGLFLFFLSMVLGRFFRGARPSMRTSF